MVKLINISTANKQKSNKKETPNISEITNYLPHHTVLNVNKPGKLGLSLMHLQNIKIFQLMIICYEGLLNNLLNNLMSVLIIFRYGKYAVIADIKSMLTK